MEKLPKTFELMDVDDGAKRQYIDSKSTFQAWEAAVKAAGEVRGGMYATVFKCHRFERWVHGANEHDLPAGIQSIQALAIRTG